jgi:hypothetical protein
MVQGLKEMGEDCKYIYKNLDEINTWQNIVIRLGKF